MKSENNGKIAIAIVAMFVVALSVVGFTYAYFTAQVRGNTGVKSVEVTAGRLEVLYEHGNVIRANNVVPGWVSNGTYYYDPVYSTKVLDPIVSGDSTTYKIVAVKTNNTVTCTNGSSSVASSCTDTAVASPTSADGITAPIAFSVSNTNNNTADTKYIIVLRDIENNIAAADKENMKVTLYSGTFDSQQPDAYKTATPIWSGTLADTTASGSYQIIVPKVETIANGGSAKNYFLVMTYVNAADTQENATAGNQDSSKAVSVSATVEIIGVEQNPAGDITSTTNWFDADGNSITFPAANTTVPSNGLSY